MRFFFKQFHRMTGHSTHANLDSMMQQNFTFIFFSPIICTKELEEIAFEIVDADVERVFKGEHKQ